MPSSSYRATGHLKPYEDIPDSQCRAICRMSMARYGYRQIFSLLRNIPPGDVTDGERNRFAEIARSRGCGVNKFRMLETRDAVEEAMLIVKKFKPDACPRKPDRRVIAALLEQREARKAKRRKKK